MTPLNGPIARIQTVVEGLLEPFQSSVETQSEKIGHFLVVVSSTIDSEKILSTEIRIPSLQKFILSPK